MIAGVLLGGGLSKRFGAQKLLVPIGRNETLITRAMRVCMGVPLHPLIVVVSPELVATLNQMNEIALKPLASLRRFALETPWGTARLVVNETPERGMSDSLKKGMAALTESEREGGVLITLADLPGISPETIRRLVGIYRAGEKKIVLPTYGGKTGHPVIIHEPSFRERIQSIEGDSGLREIIRENGQDVMRVPWPDDTVVADVDTPSDLRKILEKGC